MMRSPSLLTVLLLALLPLAPARAVDITPVPPQAVLRAATVHIHVAPDHRDWTYEVGQPSKFRVTILADHQPLADVPITYSLGPEMLPAETKTAVVPLEGLVIDGGTLNSPGFLRLHVDAEVGGHRYRGSGTAAYSPERIRPTQTEPEDFDAFWKANLEELAKLPLDARVTLVPESSTAKVNVYHVSLRTVGQSWQGVAHIYGMLCVPKAPGKYPAILRVPGAGARPYPGDVAMAERGAITFEMGVHGVPVNLPKEVYTDLLSGPLNEYWVFNLDDRQKYYYRRVYLSCIRANDFLTQLPEWDGKNLVVAGASQGGQLSIVTAALDRRVTGLCVTHPAFCDVTGYLHGRAGGWPHPFRPESSGKPSVHATPAKIATTAYYDAVNFAKRVKVPGFYLWGYNDEVCPPTSTYAAYNVITAPKQLGVTLELAHNYTPEQSDALSDWIIKFLKLEERAP